MLSAMSPELQKQNENLGAKAIGLHLKSSSRRVLETKGMKPLDRFSAVECKMVPQSLRMYSR